MKISKKGKLKSLIPVFSLMGSIPAMAGWFCECDWWQPHTDTVWTVDVNCNPPSGPAEGVTCRQFTENYPQMTHAQTRCANFAGPSMVYDSAYLPSSDWYPIGCEKKYLP